jgi:hypothetical protein
MEGTDRDDLPVSSWTAAHFPALRLELDGGGASWLNQVAQKTDVSYLFTLGVAGTDQGDALDYFELVVARLYPGDGSLYSLLKPLGVMSYSIQATGISPQPHPEGRGQVVTARFTLHHELRTKY